MSAIRLFSFKAGLTFAITDTVDDILIYLSGTEAVRSCIMFIRIR